MMTRGAEDMPRPDRRPPQRRFTSLYQFVRDQLAASGGACTRSELLKAIHRDRQASARLDQTQGFSALLSNMKHSGFLTLDDDLVRATPRRVGRRHA